jgi:hypothetical protein
MWGSTLNDFAQAAKDAHTRGRALPRRETVARAELGRKLQRCRKVVDERLMEGQRSRLPRMQLGATAQKLPESRIRPPERLQKAIVQGRWEGSRRCELTKQAHPANYVSLDITCLTCGLVSCVALINGANSCRQGTAPFERDPLARSQRQLP